MPMVHCNMIKGVFTDAEKRKLIANITEAFVDAKGEGFRDLVMVMIHEVESGHVGKGGNILTAEKVLAKAAGLEPAAR